LSSHTNKGPPASSPCDHHRPERRYTATPSSRGMPRNTGPSNPQAFRSPSAGPGAVPGASWRGRSASAGSSRAARPCPGRPGWPIIQPAIREGRVRPSDRHPGSPTDSPTSRTSARRNYGGERQPREATHPSTGSVSQPCPSGQTVDKIFEIWTRSLRPYIGL
jgi:hypothetical protein